MKLHNCAGCIGLYKNKLLFIKNTKGEVVLIKGHLEENESCKRAAAREFREETGFCDFQISKRKIANLSYTRIITNGSKEKFIIRVYLAKLQSLKKEMRHINDKKYKNIFVDASKVEEVLTYKNVLRIIKKLIKDYN